MSKLIKGYYFCKKRQIFKWYEFALNKFDDITLNPEPNWAKNVYWQPTIVFGESWYISEQKRTDIIEDLNAIGIAVRPLFYPVSSFPMYESCPDNLISQKIFSRGINLPSYFEMTKEDVDYVVSALESKLQVLCC